MKRQITVESVKRDAKAIARATTVTHSQALDVLAVQAGHSHWGSYQAAIQKAAEDRETRIARTPSPIDLMKALVPDTDFPHSLHQAKHMLVSGGTSTGKTTLINRLLSVVPKHAPIVALEEHPEIVNPNPIDHLEINGEMLRRHPQEAYRLARSRAIDNGAGVIVYPEITRGNAKDLMDAMRDPDGPTIIGSIHAPTVEDVEDVFHLLLESGMHLSRIKGRRIAEDVAIIHMSRDREGSRVISSIETL